MNLQQIIEQKAREEYESALNQIIFEKGATFATTSPEVLKEILQPFSAWMHNNFKFDDGENKWFSKHDTGPFTLEQIIGFYIQHQETKQKEDADNKTI